MWRAAFTVGFVATLMTGGGLKAPSDMSSLIFS